MTDIKEVLYHRPPMIFLDEIIESGSNFLVAAVQIREGIPFFEESRGVPAWVGLEYMAQAVAAFAGMRARADNKPIALGMLIGCRHYSSKTALFPPGTLVEIRVQELAAEENGLGSFDGALSAPDLIAEGRITVYGGARQPH
ncbi:MAG: 3-hydroxylacyl-ACP dehydratase [Gammaproteobacteria bacterium]|nr:3-hydroxylacyl-ACP dehydratase [Gammaproteobacteria bacterium]